MANWIFLHKKWIADVKAVAKKHQLSNSDLATLSDVSPSGMAVILSGEYSPKMATFVDLCGAIDLDPRKYFIKK